MNVYHYSVNALGETPSLENTLQALQGLPLDERAATCGSQKVRLETIERSESIGGEILWELKFSRIRDSNWPGVATSSSEAQDLELDADQYLSEETFAVFSETRGRIVVQYNHHGVRASRIQEYFQILSGCSGAAYQFLAALNSDALAKFQSKQFVTNVDVCIDGVTAADVAYFNGAGIGAALEAGLSAEATSLRCSFSVDARTRSNRLNRNWVERLADYVMLRGGEGDKLVVNARGSEEEAIEVIDLLDSRKITSFPDALIDRTVGRRFVPAQVFERLKQANSEW